MAKRLNVKPQRQRKVKAVKSFVISRKKWDRPGNNGGDTSGLLLRSGTGTQCCLGIYLSACGVPPRALRNIDMPRYLSAEWQRRLPGWLIAAGTAVGLASANDCAGIPETLREHRVTEGFKAQGITVTFTD